MSLMDNIRKLRKANGYSQADMAELLETTQQQYSKYENGNHEFPIRHIVKVCNHFNVSSDDLLEIKVNVTEISRGAKLKEGMTQKKKAGTKIKIIEK